MTQIIEVTVYKFHDNVVWLCHLCGAELEGAQMHAVSSQSFANILMSVATATANQKEHGNKPKKVHHALQIQ